MSATSVSIDPSDASPPDLGAIAALVDATMLGAVALDIRRGNDGRVADAICLDATPGACRLLMVSQADILHRSFLPVLARWTGGDPKAALARALSGETVDGSVDRMTGRSDGSVSRARLTRSGRGVIVLFAEVTAEVGASTRAADWQERAEIAEQQLVDLHGADPDPVALFDAEDRLVLCNDSWAEMSGLKPQDDLLGRRFEDLVTEMRTSGCWKDVPAKAAEVLLELRLDSHQRASGAPVEFPGLGGRTFRVSERRTAAGGVVCRATESTGPADQRQLLFRAIESIDQALALYDRDDRLVIWNSRYAEAVGANAIRPGMTFSEAAARISKSTIAMTTRDGRPIEPVDRIAFHQSGSGTFEFERWHADGTVSVVRERRMPDGWIAVTGSPITALKIKEAALEDQVSELDSARAEAERHADHLAEATRQLTQEKERAEAANRTKSRFLANMSHELRTPLNAILGFSEMIKGETFGPLGSPRYGDYAEDIHASGRHLLSLINDILDMSKIEAGKYRLAKESVSLASVIASVARMVRGRADEADLLLTIDSVADDLRISIDARAVKQVLINLLTNAIKFTPAGGFVELDCSIEGAAAIISVRDSGIRIDPEEIPRLLHPFEQTQSGDQRSAEGTGLGLPLSHALVELHGGTMTIDSALGAGTCVTVVLPLE